MSSRGNEGCGHPVQPSTNIAQAATLDPPMYVKFTCRDEWHHIPANEIIPSWIGVDIAMAVKTFRELHGSDGVLVAFTSTDLIEWKMVGE